MTNPLDRHPRIRQGLLDVQWAITGVQTVLSALFLFLYGENLDRWPMWFLASLAVPPVLWAYLGRTARGNVTGTDAAGMPLTTTEE